MFDECMEAYNGEHGEETTNYKPQKSSDIRRKSFRYRATPEVTHPDEIDGVRMFQVFIFVPFLDLSYKSDKTLLVSCVNLPLLFHPAVDKKIRIAESHRNQITRIRRFK